MAFGLGNRCSILLSYEGKLFCLLYLQLIRTAPNAGCTRNSTRNYKFNRHTFNRHSCSRFRSIARPGSLARCGLTEESRLYEQGATETRLWQYVSRWTRWLWGGLDGLVSRKGGIRRYYSGVIKRLRIRGLYRPIQSCPGYKTGLPAPLL